MANNIQFYAQMADQTAEAITGSYQEWTAFLTTAARLYKYPYHEQLMIYAQRPEATACAEYDFWNKRMRRYVRRGSKGIALVDPSGERPSLRYVFDVADTGGGDNARRPYLWQLQDEHMDTVLRALETRYGVSGRDGLEEQLELVANRLAKEYWEEHQRDILSIVDGSFLEEYDDYNVGASFRSAASTSITHALMTRCGLDPEQYFGHEDFLSVLPPPPSPPWARRSARPASRCCAISKSPSNAMSGKKSRKGARTMKMDELTYTQNGDYLIPNLTLSEPPEAAPLGKYGRMRRTYLKEHRPILFQRLVLEEKLYAHLREIDETAHQRLSEMMPQMAKEAGVTEALKAADPMKWTGMMNTLKAQAEEIILNELVFS